LTLLFESWTLFIIGWIPFYSWLRLIFLLYLVLPQTQGAKILYLDYLEPYIVHHETQIDQFIGDTHDRLQQMGLGYLSIAIEWARDRILGQKSPQQGAAAAGQQQGAGAGGYASYATDLLSRFAMPGARTNTPTQPGTSSSTVYNTLSNLAGAAFATSSSQRSAATEAASINIPPSLFNFDNIPGQSTAEKASFISAQQNRLQGLLKMLDKEQQNLDLAYGADPRGERGGNGSRSASGSGNHSKRPSSSGSGLAIGGGLKTKSRSEQSFENVEYDEADDRERDPRRTSGGWIAAGVSGWLAGSNPGAGGDADRGEREKKRDSGDTLTSRGWSAARDMTEEISRGMSSGYDRSREESERRR
jgi:hypothetical protein